ncbi:branched-chain amino acid transport system substrate-binding protein [Bradyrhizobium japonicum]|jgi:branched-chain amino acid transport system substrate-binding protein|uniref:Branched-chain amino acid transport system substrate-binding protein n=1 Tax=Bradyrhizobium elkanii TaxID=29448 RepID=A0ABV4F404_BRAEL|nr:MULTISPECIES: ABC transporter substrate-binding protein [Bradyrhizobium]MBP2434877.1 branched-chain amino acid transport system substrate-binding protein [Bradyrhizobium elkanii]MCP1731888.1 branched-chain amino acid transport system substrate-binding protein [Bradyrhizobium elkanii]MCP1749585.1 branched-chain amino acid transport system substrate-binding protein [Bradyrhizobium elkanii]MCP1932686.1 branched-chain amino acid transport system substrate-binding protein [Bradyrhizobium elkanii]
MKSIVTSLSAAGLIAAVLAGPALAQQAPLKIGVLTDFQSVYSDIGGAGNVEATKMAIEEFGGSMFGKPIELVTADALNKADVAATITRKWYEAENVDMIIDMPTSATALAGMEMSKQFEKIMIVTDAASSDITGKSCSPYTLHWTYDTYANAHTVGSAIVKNGGDTWFFITADYLFGHSIERDTGDVVRAAGGKVLGSARHPLNTPDFSSFLLQAQASKAKIIGMANGGADTINTIKQASEFGIVAGGQNLAGIVMFISDIHSLGLKLAQGLIITEAYYWDLNDRTRAFGKRFFERMKRMPTMNQAATYSATLHYLNAVKAAGTKETKPVLAKMRATPVRDAFTDNGVVREDGRMVHSMFLFEVKKPEESKAPWDYYKVLAEVPGDQAFRPLKDGGCPLIK